MASNPAWRRRRRIAARIALAVAALPVLYLLVAAILGAVPANVAWREPQQGIAIFVRTNGVHTWIVMPKANAAIDWSGFAPGAHLADPRWGRGNHVAIGYGDRDFYLNTPTWGDLSPRTAFAALFGGSGGTLLHVEHDHNPRPDPWTRRIKVTPDQYRRLVRFIAARFRLDGEGRTVPLLGRGYNANDMFYEANGGYSFVLTCNEWTGRALRAAGIRTGLWTPFAQSVMWRLD